MQSAGAGTHAWNDGTGQCFYWTQDAARPRLVERIPGYHVGEDNSERPQEFVNLGLAPPNRVLDDEEVHQAIESSMAGGELDPRRKSIVFNKL
eukprot:SAG31_NODE_5822_length_2309_cov_1.138009_3_plen_93_part_00